MANINFNDVPFIVAARRTFQCQYGRMQCGTRKNKEKRESLGIPQVYITLDLSKSLTLS